MGKRMQRRIRRDSGLTLRDLILKNENVRTELEEEDDNYYCPNDECDVKDGIHKDESNLLEFGKNEFVVHVPTNEIFYDKCMGRQIKEDDLKNEWVVKCTLWQNMYYNTFDYQVMQKVKDFVNKIKRFIKKRPTIIEYEDEKYETVNE